MALERAVWTGAVWQVFQTAGTTATPFVPGVTMPRYIPTADFSGAKNVGNLPGVTLTPYGGAGGGAILQLTSGTYTDTDFGDRRLDLQGTVTLNNCRVCLTTSNYSGYTTDGIQAVVQRLNGAAGTLTMNDCEVHNRAQVLQNCFTGRNATFNRCVFTGGTDALNDSTSGGAPQTSGLVVNDCWLGDLSWWYYTSAGVVQSGDTQTHNDCYQQATTLGTSITNTFCGAWPSEFVGTGTPNCGTATNPNTLTYIAAQATMNGWRTSFLNQVTRADQSFDGVARKTSTGGSWCGLMINRENITALHCWISGGTVSVNASNTSTWTVAEAGTAISIKQCTIWNDMSAGHTLPTDTTKGYALYMDTGRTYNSVPLSGVDRNVWFDGSTIGTLQYA